MTNKTERARVALFHYQCPECGVGDPERGHYATVEMIWCEVCLEQQRPERLKRWPVGESGLPPRPARR
jgi:hypothetical protein